MRNPPCRTLSLLERGSTSFLSRLEAAPTAGHAPRWFALTHAGSRILSRTHFRTNPFVPSLPQRV
ncbi:MAG: hypothetical protein KC931_15205, partial [Candidatus Omnitrophica bacterium]|nr:hypothetical protein [Candidatus Omnitrophota bacterium]